MPFGRYGRPVWRWLLIVALVAWCAGAALLPSQAEPPCLGLEDGRCLPAPVAVHDGPRLIAGSRLEPRAPASPKGPGVLVRRRDDIAPARLAAALGAQGSDDAHAVGARGWWRVSPAPGESVADLLARLRAMPEIAYAEEDTPVAASYLPDDPRLADQWALLKIRTMSAWDRTTSSDDVWIAVVDTGVDAGRFPSSSRLPHPDRPADLLWGYDYANDDDDPWDDNGHGTHVAGIAAAATDNGLGVAGLCPGCDVLAIKVLAADGRGWNSDVADGIAYAAYWGSQAGKRTVINVSLGGGYSSAVAEAVTDAQGLGALVVAAAGNDGPMPPNYPAALSGVLAVTATDAHDFPAGFSQYGDIAAPGVSILSTVPTWSVVGGEEPYEPWSGTSMASPVVAGAAGLVWSLAPSLSAAEVSGYLLDNVDVPAGWNPAYGVGRLNLAAALPPDPTPTATDTPVPTLTPTATPEPSATPREAPTVPAPTPTRPPNDATPIDTPGDIPNPPAATPVVTEPGAAHVVTFPLVIASR